MPPSALPGQVPSKASLKSWWKHWILVQKMKAREPQYDGQCHWPRPLRACVLHRTVLIVRLFGQGKYLESRYGKVCGRRASKSQLPTRTGTHTFSTATTIRLISLSTRELYVWGYIPVVVAKWCVVPKTVANLPDVPLAYSGLFLKEHGTETDSRNDSQADQYRLAC